MQQNQVDRQRTLIETGELIPLLRKIRGGTPVQQRDNWHRFVTEVWICDGLKKLRDCSASDLREHLDRNSVAHLLRHAILSKSSRLVREHLAIWEAFGAHRESSLQLASAIDKFNGSWSSRFDQRRVGRVIDLRDGSLDIRFSQGLTDFCKTLLLLKSNDCSNFIGDAIPIEMIGSGVTSVEFPIVDVAKTEPSPLLNVDFSIALSFSDSTAIDCVPESGIVRQRWEAFLDGLLESSLGLRHRNDLNAVETKQFNRLRLPDWLQDYTTALNVSLVQFDSAGLAAAIQMILRGEKIPFGLGFSGKWDNGQLQPICDLNRKMIAAKNAGCVLFFACVDAIEWNDLDPPLGLQIVALPRDQELAELLPLINYACGATGFTDFYAKCRAGVIENSFIKKNAEISPPDSDDRYPVGFVGRKDDLISLTQRLQSGATGMAAVVAPARVGKTSLLMKTVENVCPRPAWFKIDRTVPRTRYCELLMSSLYQQISDRYAPLRSSLDTAKQNNTFPPIVGALSIVVDGMDEAANDEEAAKVQESLSESFPTARILLGTQPNVVSNVEEVFPISFPRFDDEWTATEHSIKDAAELVKRYQERFNKKNLLREASLVAKEGYSEKAAKRARGGLGHLTEFLESVCRQHETLPDDPDSFPVFSDEKKYVSDLLERMLENYDQDERSRIELFTATLAFMRGRTWPINDVVRLAELEDDSRFGEWAPTGLLSKGFGRILECTPGHVRFYSPHTAQAVRVHYQSEFPTIARKMFSRLQSPKRDELTESLVNNIAGLVTEFGTPALGDELLSTDWARTRFESLVGSSDRVRLLVDELHQLPTIEKTAQAQACSDWIVRWKRDIDETPEVRSSWSQYDPSGLLSQNADCCAGVPIFFNPCVIQTGICPDADDNSRIDMVHLRINGDFRNGTISICVAYVIDHFDLITTHHRNVALDGSVTIVGKRHWDCFADDNLECRLHGQSCILEARSTPTDDWSRFELANLLGLTSQREHELNTPVVEIEELDWNSTDTPNEMESDIEPQLVLEIHNAVITSSTTVTCSAQLQTGGENQRWLVLVEFVQGKTPHLERVQLFGEHGDLQSGMNDLLVFQDHPNLDNHGFVSYVVDATTGEFFPEKGTFPSLQLVSISKEMTLILVEATDKGCNGAYLHTSGTMPPRYLADTTRLSKKTFVADSDDDRVALVSVVCIDETWGIQRSVLQLSTGIIIEQRPESSPADHVTINGWVRDCTVAEDLIFIAFQSGRIEVRSKCYPNTILALAFVAVSFEGESDAWVRITDLKASRTSNGFWLWVATNQLNRFDLSELVKAEGAS